MGTPSESSEGGGVVGDCGVGTIVWVRRRNGSWWPGRVLGADELAESQLMSPRSGTPVKLLGREDASVDWYNLEKSKRVKPFRCGDFDACIEKAEASYSTPIKRREKYARREDAILHALELERHHLERKESTSISCQAGNKTSNICERGSNHYTSEIHVQSKHANQKTQTSSGKITSLLDEYYLDHPLPVPRNRKVKPDICEYDSHEIATYMGENADAEVCNSKGKLFHSTADRNLDLTGDNQSYLLRQSGHNLVFITQEAIGKNLSALKRKSLPPGAVSGTPAKRRDRRRRLVKVLQKSMKFPDSYSLQFQHDSTSNMVPGEEDRIGITHDAQKETSIHSSPDADDSLDYSRYSWKHTPEDAVNACYVQQSGVMSNESTPSEWTGENEFDSSATDSELEIVTEKLRSGIAQPFNRRTVESPIESGISQWHLKGKRNHRNITKKLHESVDEKNLGGTDISTIQLREASPGKFESAMFSDALGHQFSSEREIDYDTEEYEFFAGVENKRDDLSTQHGDFIDSEDELQLVSQSGWRPASPPFPTWRVFWEEPEDNFDQFRGSSFIPRIMPMLVDVDLKVQARYRGQHVPLVSLMSKLNGKAIIGHPVRIEVLEDGSTDLLFSLNMSDDGDATCLQIWTTAKRTSVPRVPRTNPDPPSSYIQSPALPLKKKSIYHSHRSASGRFQRNPLKMVSLSSSQKTRALSSFIPDRIHDPLIKPDGPVPAVACIPTKVVFSRILESVGRLSPAVARWVIAGSSSENAPI